MRSSSAFLRVTIVTLGLCASQADVHAQAGKAASAAAAPPRGAKALPSANADTLDPVAPSFDHSAFDALLRQHVDHGLVDYAAFRNNAQFATYLASLNTVDLKKFDEPERIAFWLNVYNAYTIQLVASRGETGSIRNIDKTFGVFSLKGPWSERFVKAAGQTLSLDDVEHRILRKEFSEPRVHFAMSFAANGGPALRSEAYSGAKLDDQLEDQARQFLLKSPTKNRVVASERTVYASPILTRYRADFGSSPSALGAFLAEYYPPDSDERKLLRPRVVRIRNGGGGPFQQQFDVPPTAKEVAARTPAQRDSAKSDSGRRVASVSSFRIEETTFDWSLNIQPGRKLGR